MFGGGNTDWTIARTQENSSMGNDDDKPCTADIDDAILVLLGLHDGADDDFRLPSLNEQRRRALAEVATRCGDAGEGDPPA